MNQPEPWIREDLFFPVEHVFRVDVADDGQLVPDGAVDAGRQSAHVAAHDAEQLGDVA